MTVNIEEEKAFTTEEAADFLRVKPQTLAKHRMNRVGPPWCVVGVGRGRIVYLKSELVQFLKESRSGRAAA